MATSLNFSEPFFVCRKRKTEFKKPTTGCCFPCESEFTRAGNFQTNDSDFALAIFKQRIPIPGWFFNLMFKFFFLAAIGWSERQVNERLKHRKSWFHEKHFFPPPHPFPSTFLLSSHFSRGLNAKNSFAWPEFRLLRTGTLATQASSPGIQMTAKLGPVCKLRMS